MRYNLKDTSFIIPIYIDSQDRLKNAKIVLNYLCYNFDTNIFIYEVYNEYSKLDFIKDIKNSNIVLISEKYNGIFHRTKYLNILLNMITTKVVVNYDIDILLPINNYILAQNYILDNYADIIYPFGNDYNLYNLYNVKLDEKYLNNPSIDNLSYSVKQMNFSNVGFCIFFSTLVYKKGGGENEEFISWGPEDQERFYRFKTLGYNIKRFEKEYVYHLEHLRTDTSNKTNKYYINNMKLYNNIILKNRLQLTDYIYNQPYLKKYNFII